MRILGSNWDGKVGPLSSTVILINKYLWSTSWKQWSASTVLTPHLHTDYTGQTSGSSRLDMTTMVHLTFTIIFSFCFFFFVIYLLL